MAGEVERAKGFEPSQEAWKAAVLPLHHARTGAFWQIQGARSTVFEILGSALLTQRRLVRGDSTGVSVNVEVCAHARQAQGGFQLRAEIAHGQRAFLFLKLSLHSGYEADSGRVHKLHACHVHDYILRAGGDELVQSQAKLVHSAQVQDSSELNDGVCAGLRSVQVQVDVGHGLPQSESFQTLSKSFF